jgi:hypothetical protein
VSVLAAAGGPSPWLTFAASVIGGGVVGTVISTYVTTGREGRAARAKVRECLADTEDLRWLDSDYQEFRKAISRLDSAALIARFDRSLIHRYTYLATTAHYTEIKERAEFPNLPLRSLPLELAVLMEGLVATLANEAWRPRLWRFRKKRYIWIIDKTIAQRRDEHPEWAWDAPMFRPVLMTKEPGLKAFLARRCRPGSVTESRQKSILHI